ncbi:hypothetical protein GCM10007071_34510 [Marinobacter zhanjiangensis]|uniref:Uncharacterized protein n=1 Tax=Marinobacter zhanjiangensis TaxID=578215 RepID=A0ABQ3B8T8_9GAMM|nr:hypothetical protein GCM10007071_34510 [Marinobacter zhanjiangensis]
MHMESGGYCKELLQSNLSLRDLVSAMLKGRIIAFVALVICRRTDTEDSSRQIKQSGSVPFGKFADLPSH